MKRITQTIDIQESWYGYGPPETWKGVDGVPLTKKGEKIKKAMEKEYGKEKGESVFYASQNKGTIKGTHRESSEGGKHERKEKKGR